MKKKIETALGLLMIILVIVLICVLLTRNYEIKQQLQEPVRSVPENATEVIFKKDFLLDDKHATVYRMDMPYRDGRKVKEDRIYCVRIEDQFDCSLK